MKTLQLAALTAFGLWLVLAPTLSAGQLHPSAQDQQYKVKSKGGSEHIRDKSKPIRKALEEQYAKMVAAYRDNAPDVILGLRVPDFSVQAPNGELWNAQRSAEYIRASFQQVDRTLDLSFTIKELDVHGAKAAALIHQQWSRLQRMGGQVRRVETSACQRETWINTSEGWRLQLIDSVQPLVWKVDGKRVDPSLPFDAEAPPFVPDIEAVSGCTDKPEKH